jgi:hypothetical protein
MRARASSRISWLCKCAPTAPSPTRRAKPTSLRAGAAERSRRLAARRRIRARPVQLRQGLAQVSPFDFAKSAERNADAFCRQGFGALLAGFAEGHRRQLSTPATTIDTRRDVTVETPKGTITAPAADRHRASTNVIAPAASNSRPNFPAAARRLRQAFARQLRPHRARTCRQSARLRERRSGVREIGRPAYRRDPRQRVRHAALPDRGRRRVRPRSLRRRAKPRWSTSPPNGSPASTAPR